jgi:ribokinase
MSTSSNANKGRVVVVGSANQDLTSYTKTVPTMGETVMGETFETSCGGKGANQAVAAAKLGFVPVTMVCRVGDDTFGKDLLNNFRK